MAIEVGPQVDQAKHRGIFPCLQCIARQWHYIAVGCLYILVIAMVCACVMGICTTYYTHCTREILLCQQRVKDWSVLCHCDKQCDEANFDKSNLVYGSLY